MKRVMIDFLIGAALIAVFIVFIAPFMFLYMHIHPPRLQNMFKPSDFGMKYEDITLKTKDNVNLKGWYMPVEHKKGTMLVCHGVAANKSDIIQVSILFNSKGYDVYSFDFRGHGETKEGNVTYGYDERKDIKTIINYIKSKGEERIGAYGLSMGAAILMLSLPENPEIKVAVIDSGFASAEKIARYRIGMVFPEPILSMLLGITNFYSKTFYNVSLFDISPLEVIDTVNIPLLFVIGDKDTNITPDNGEMLYAKAKEPKELLVIEGANHTQTMNSPLFKEQVVSFVDKYLLDTKAD